MDGRLDVILLKHRILVSVVSGVLFFLFLLVGVVPARFFPDQLLALCLWVYVCYVWWETLRFQMRVSRLIFVAAENRMTVVLRCEDELMSHRASYVGGVFLPGFIWLNLSIGGRLHHLYLLNETCDPASHRRLRVYRSLIASAVP